MKEKSYIPLTNVGMENRLFENLDETARFVNQLPQEYLGPIIKCLVIRIKELETRVLKLEGANY